MSPSSKSSLPSTAPIKNTALPSSVVVDEKVPASNSLSLASIPSIRPLIRANSDENSSIRLLSMVVISATLPKQELTIVAASYLEIDLPVISVEHLLI